LICDGGHGNLTGRLVACRLRSSSPHKQVGGE
jgi:hypothetical protein